LKISVIIPVYNAAAFLEKAVESALMFSEVEEIVLIEDKSPDNSLEICQKLVEKDKRVKLFQHPDKGNHGAGASRNLGLEKASQEFIAFLDSDDYYLPNRFDAEKEIFKDSKIEGVFNAIGTDFITEKGKKEFQSKFSSDLTTVQYAAEGKEVFEGLLGFTSRPFGTFFHLNGLTIRKSALEKSKLMFNQNLRVHQDSDFIIKLSYLANLKSGNITEAVAMRGVHDDNRITKIKLYSSKYFERQFLLQESLWNWGKNIPISKEIKNKLHLKYISLKASNKKGISKLIYYFSNALLQPELLKTQYRFNALTKHQ
jgi:glycosyltransferase involved in cell wall biosynthesis